jgi:hypothetical protein
MDNDLNINWKDGVGEVTDQPLTVSPGSGVGDASVSFGSVMNNGLDRTLELEITTPKGTKKTLTVNQEGCRQAYITSDGKRWLTSDNRVYGVLKSDAPCECLEVTPNVIGFKIDDANSDPVIESCGDSSWIKGRRCLVKKTDTGVAICYLDENNSELFHDGLTPASLDGSMGQWMTDIPSYRYSHKGGEYDVSNIQNLVHEITLTHNDSDDNITEWGNAGLFRRCLVGVTKAINIDGKLWSKKGVRSTGNLTPVVFHDYAIALGDGFDIIDYETHCKIAHLFYAKYANRNSQKMSQFGYGSTSYPRVSGTTSSLGNNDGKTSTQISFLGIEDFYGNMSEWVGGIHSNNSVYYIYDGFEINTVPTSGYRTIDIGGSSRYGYINKVYWGEHGDMIPIEIGASPTTNYCDYSWIARKNWNIACRSSSGGGDNGGVAFFDSSYSNNMSESSCGSRIQYRGPIQVIEDPAEFIAMPDGFIPPQSD